MFMGIRCTINKFEIFIYSPTVQRCCPYDAGYLVPCHFHVHCTTHTDKNICNFTDPFYYIVVVYIMPIIDYNVPIPCPNCGEDVVHRYDCTCGNQWGYCRSEDHVFFWCTTCELEAKVNWDDMPKSEPLMGREEREKLSGVELDPEDIEREREGLQRIFDTWDDKASDWKLDARRRMMKQDPDNPLLKGVRLVS